MSQITSEIETLSTSKKVLEEKMLPFPAGTIVKVSQKTADRFNGHRFMQVQQYLVECTSSINGITRPWKKSPVVCIELVDWWEAEDNYKREYYQVYSIEGDDEYSSITLPTKVDLAEILTSPYRHTRKLGARVAEQLNMKEESNGV
jgi:hypothetical protein